MKKIVNIDEKKRAIFYKIVVPKDKLDILKAKDKGSFDYTYYLFVNSVAKTLSFGKSSKDSVCDDDIEVVHLVVLRNVYNNEVIRKKDSSDSYVFQLENIWIDDCPFDDYTVLSAKKIMDRLFGGMQAKDFTAELFGKTSLKVCGATYMKGKIYVLTQIIFPDYFPSMPYNLKREKIYNLDRVIQFGGKDDNFIERKVFPTLYQVDKGVI